MLEAPSAVAAYTLSSRPQFCKKMHYCHRERKAQDSEDLHNSFELSTNGFSCVRARKRSHGEDKVVELKCVEGDAVSSDRDVRIQ